MTVGKNPTEWSPEERELNEAAISDRYAATRPVTDRTTRNKALADLPSAPDPDGLASQRPATTCPDCT